MPHLVRINGKKCTGWQVRLMTGQPKKYRSKLFSDRPHGGPDAARAAAEAWLGEHRGEDTPPAPNNGHHQPYYSRPPAHNTSGILGVYRTHAYHSRTHEKQEYWGAFCPAGPRGQRYHRRFYINGEREEEEAFRLAVAFRQAWQEAADQGPAALRRFWDEVESGWV